MPLPPLNALRAFESAARNGGYVAAARELGVTPAAISQQVRHLEAHLGRRLFQRHNNRITLTDAGQAIFADTARVFADLIRIDAQAREGRSPARLVISCLPSLAEGWLMPRLAAAEGAARIDLRLESDPVAFARDNIDLRLCYGSGLYPDLVQVPLFRDAVLPMAAPALAARWPDIPDSALIHTDWGPGFASHPAWRDWFAAHLPDRPAPVRGTGHRIGGSYLALRLAAGGQGVVLGQRALAAPMLADGSLVALAPQALPLGHDYVAVHSPARARNLDLQRMLELLAKPG